MVYVGEVTWREGVEACFKMVRIRDVLCDMQSGRMEAGI